MPDVTIEPGHVAAHRLTITSDPTRVTVNDWQATIEIISDGAAVVWYTLDGSPPAVAGPRSYVMPAGGTAIDERSTAGRPRLTVTLIAEGAATVSVQRGS